MYKPYSEGQHQQADYGMQIRWRLIQNDLSMNDNITNRLILFVYTIVAGSTSTCLSPHADLMAVNSKCRFSISLHVKKEDKLNKQDIKIGESSKISSSLLFRSNNDLVSLALVSKQELSSSLQCSNSWEVSANLNEEQN